MFPCMLKTPAMGLNRARNSSKVKGNEAASIYWGMKKCRVSGSLWLALSPMVPLCAAMNELTAAMMPGRSGQFSGNG